MQRGVLILKRGHALDTDHAGLARLLEYGARDIDRQPVARDLVRQHLQLRRCRFSRIGLNGVQGSGHLGELLIPCVIAVRQLVQRGACNPHGLQVRDLRAQVHLDLRDRLCYVHIRRVIGVRKCVYRVLQREPHAGTQLGVRNITLHLGVVLSVCCVLLSSEGGVGSCHLQGSVAKRARSPHISPQTIEIPKRITNTIDEAFFLIVRCAARGTAHCELSTRRIRAFRSAIAGLTAGAAASTRGARASLSASHHDRCRRAAAHVEELAADRDRSAWVFRRRDDMLSAVHVHAKKPMPKFFHLSAAALAHHLVHRHQRIECLRVGEDLGALLGISEERMQGLPAITARLVQFLRVILIECLTRGPVGSERLGLPLLLFVRARHHHRVHCRAE